MTAGTCVVALTPHAIAVISRLSKGLALLSSKASRARLEAEGPSTLPLARVLLKGRWHLETRRRRGGDVARPLVLFKNRLRPHRHPPNKSLLRPLLFVASILRVKFYVTVNDTSASKVWSTSVGMGRLEIEWLTRPPIGLVHGDWAQLVRRLLVALGRRLYRFSLSRPYQTLLLVVAGCLCQQWFVVRIVAVLFFGLLSSDLK